LNFASLRPESIKKLIDLIHPSFGREGGCESPGKPICRLVDSRNNLLRKKRPSGPDPQMNRKRGEGLSLKGGKEGWGFVLGGAALRSFRKERISESLSNLFYLSLEVGREKVNMSVGFSNETKHFFVFIIRKAQSHTLTSMMGTTSALRRSNEQQFSALLRELHS
jgi:hypothetical protein